MLHSASPGVWVKLGIRRSAMRHIIFLSNLVISLLVLCACTPSETITARLSPIPTFTHSISTNSPTPFQRPSATSSPSQTLTPEPTLTPSTTPTPASTRITSGKLKIQLVESKSDADSAQIYIVKADGSAVISPTKAFVKIEGHSSKWSPNGKWVAFVHQGQLHVADENGTQVRKITDFERLVAGVSAWSNDSQRITFVPLNGPEDDIAGYYDSHFIDYFEVNRDGSKLKFLRSYWFTKWNETPTPVPPNSLLNRDQHIYFVDGQGQQSLIHSNVIANLTEFTDAFPSPEGKHIAFTAWCMPVNEFPGCKINNEVDTRSRELFIFDIKQRLARYIHTTDPIVACSDDPWCGRRVVWSPDGKRLAFTTSGEGSIEMRTPDRVYIINTDGAWETLVWTSEHDSTVIDSYDVDLEWQPLP
jgi:Tol biopolymer transport system component